MTAEWRSAVAYLLAEEGLQHLAEEEQQRVPGVQQVGAVHGHVLGAGSRDYINLCFMK